jgi:hypothetical protein
LLPDGAGWAADSIFSPMAFVTLRRLGWRKEVGEEDMLAALDEIQAAKQHLADI